jgi:hypothetical protein
VKRLYKMGTGLTLPPPLHTQRSRRTNAASHRFCKDPSVLSSKVQPRESRSTSGHAPFRSRLVPNPKSPLGLLSWDVAAGGCVPCPPVEIVIVKVREEEIICGVYPSISSALLCVTKRFTSSLLCRLNWAILWCGTGKETVLVFGEEVGEERSRGAIVTGR